MTLAYLNSITEFTRDTSVLDESQRQAPMTYRYPSAQLHDYKYRWLDPATVNSATIVDESSASEAGRAVNSEKVFYYNGFSLNQHCGVITDS
ncbi:hypothetical protein EVAR_10622_1 [Eumeta japonica]|uniref:Uncharacterized protein n=1 Tax=Eumeta variegata TaxID=151549 RepID=A0A4C1U2I7_EUMVA|nr:hypothetical protein EVAR_10622_1 [Eumeta japonica]